MNYSWSKWKDNNWKDNTSTLAINSVKRRLSVFTFPVAAVNLDTHADSAAVVAVGEDAHFTRLDGRIYLPLGLQVSVRVPLDHL